MNSTAPLLRVTQTSAARAHVFALAGTVLAPTLVLVLGLAGTVFASQVIAQAGAQTDADPKTTAAADCTSHAKHESQHDNCQTSYQDLDWVPYQNLPGELQLERAQHCGGGYLDPLRHMDTRVDPNEEEIETSSVHTEIEGNIFRLTGGASLRQGYRQLSADTVEYDHDNGTGTLEGNVVFREPGILMRGDRGWVDIRNAEAKLWNSDYTLHQKHVRGGAELIHRREDEIIELNTAYYSYCPPTAEFWRLNAGELELDLENGVGTAREAKLQIKGRSVFYFPYLQFPIDDRRKSGFLWPEFGKDSSGGIDIALPYYFNLAPNYDATITPRLVNDRGLLLEVQGRYLGPLLGFWDVGGSYIDADKKYRDENEDVSGDRWLGSVDQHGLIDQRWRTIIDYTDTSDKDYLNDIGTSSLDVRQSTHLIQRGQLDYLGDNWQAEVRLEQFQTIAKDVISNPYKKLPEVSLFRTAPIEDYTPNVLFQSEYTLFDHETRRTGHRLYNEVGVNYPMTSIWGELTPLVKYRQINYDLDEAIIVGPHSGDTPDVGAPLLSLDGSLFFERDMQWGDSTLLQTLEPRLYYLWADYEEQTGLPNFDTSTLTFTYNQLFRETRFSGHDRLNDANQVSTGVTTRIIDPASGRELLSASIGQIYYFEDRRVSSGAPREEDLEGSSAIAAEFSTSPLVNLGFTSSWLWNTDTDRMDATHLRLSRTTERNRIFNLGYNWRRYTGNNPTQDDINQVDASAYLPFAKHWAFFFQSLYDLDQEKSVNDVAGIEYNDCCWRVRVLHQRSLNQEVGTIVGSQVNTKKATFVEFQLKGLGGVGTRVTSILEESIRGYESSEY